MLEAIAAGREPFAAGQFASFDFAARDEGGAPLVLNRTWTVSSHPRETAARRGDVQGQNSVLAAMTLPSVLLPERLACGREG
jgi:ferredoxin-NADP reductase